MKRFVELYEKDNITDCAYAYYFDQRLSNKTVLRQCAERYAKQLKAYEQDPSKYCPPTRPFARIFAGEKFDTSHPLTKTVDLRSII